MVVINYFQVNICEKEIDKPLNNSCTIAASTHLTCDEAADVRNITCYIRSLMLADRAQGVAECKITTCLSRRRGRVS